MHYWLLLNSHKWQWSIGNFMNTVELLLCLFRVNLFLEKTTLFLSSSIIITRLPLNNSCMSWSKCYLLQKCWDTLQLESFRVTLGNSNSFITDYFSEEFTFICRTTFIDFMIIHIARIIYLYRQQKFHRQCIQYSNDSI